MARILIGMIAAVTCFVLAESLTCNMCSFGLSSYCMSASEVECSTNTSYCFTGKTNFSIPMVGFTTQGCIEGAKCNMSNSASLLGVSYTYNTECCSTDKCNTVESGAATSRLSLTVAMSAALVASAWSLQ